MTIDLVARSKRHWAVLLCATALLAGCVEEEGPERTLGHHESALAYPGPWVIPPEVRAIGDTQTIEYTGAGPWVGTSGCSGYFTEGAQIFRAWLYANFPQVTHVGGYACRAINGDSTTMSVHATGRALDIHIPLDGGEADNGLGDPIANWLIMHAEEIGIQYIIWDRWTWGGHRAAGSKDREYGGAHPHHDHLHIELSVDASQLKTDWFNGPMGAPEIDPCGIIPAMGGVVDERGPCFAAIGPATYWRSVDGEGFDDHLFWTNAFEASAPSNWARWFLHFEEEGDYEVAVFTVPQWSVYDQTRYGLMHDGMEDVLYVDQSAGDGWLSLGTFHFAAGGSQHLDMYDNVAGAVGADQHIIADAIRLNRILPGGDTQPPTDTSLPPRDTSGPDTWLGDAPIGSDTVASHDTWGSLADPPAPEDGGADTGVGSDANRGPQVASDCACSLQRRSTPLPAWAALFGLVGWLVRRRRAMGVQS